MNSFVIFFWSLVRLLAVGWFDWWQQEYYLTTRKNKTFFNDNKTNNNKSDWFNPAVSTRRSCSTVAAIMRHSAFLTKIRNSFKNDEWSCRLFARIDLLPKWSRCNLIQSDLSPIWFIGCRLQKNSPIVSSVPIYKKKNTFKG